MIKKIVFDLGGVILDFNHRIISKRLSDISAKDEAEIFDFIFKSGIEKLYDTGKLSSEEYFLKIRSFINSEIQFDTFSKIWNDIFYEKPEMSQVLNSIKENNHSITLLSNTNELHFNYCIQKFPVLNLFDDYFLSYKIGIRKPDAEIFIRLTNELELKPNELLFIDDVEENVKAANNLNINTIHYVSHNYFLKRMKYFNIIQ